MLKPRSSRFSTRQTHDDPPPPTSLLLVLSTVSPQLFNIHGSFAAQTNTAPNSCCFSSSNTSCANLLCSPAPPCLASLPFHSALIGIPCTGCHFVSPPTFTAVISPCDCSQRLQQHLLSEDVKERHSSPWARSA